MKKNEWDKALGIKYPSVVKTFLKKTGLTLCVIFIFSMGAIASVSYSQMTKISLDLNNVPVKKVLESIERQSEFSFLYSEKIIDVERKVSIKIKESAIEAILDRIFEGSNVKYTVKGNQIALISFQTYLSENQPSNVQNAVKSDQIALASPQAGSSESQPSKSVSGKVIDTSGESITGVSVMLKGTTIRTITDSNGNYMLSNISANKILLFTFMGMKTQEIVIGTKSVINVTLEEGAIGLEEVVAVGYGTQKKTSITGSVSSISSKEILQAPTSNLTNSLAGLLPGLIATSPNGSPGNGSSISIRGKSTWGDNSVLVVVDGVVRSFDQIDPNEVENITVLKDAAAAAVYGARAANGVILVTTKRGQGGKPKFNYNGYVGLQKPTLYPDLMNAYEWATTNNAARLNMGYDPAVTPGLFYNETQLAAFKDGSVGTDWYDVSFKKQSMQVHHSLGIDGGNDQIKYFFNLGYMNQDGMYNNINFDRYNFRSNVDAKITKYLNIAVDIDGRIEKRNSPEWTEGSIFGHVIRQRPTYEDYLPDGLPANTTGEHPLLEINSKGYIKDTKNIFYGTIVLTHDLPFVTKGLSANGKISYNQSYNFTKEFDVPYTMYDENAQGEIIGTKVVGKNKNQIELQEDFVQSKNMTLNLSLNYKRQFGKHDVGALLLYEQFQGTGDNFNAYRSNFPSSAIDQLFFGGTGSADKNNTGAADESGRMSYVGRLNYGFDSRYLLEASFRYDGSSIFPKGNRFGFFPAISGGWRISEEKFFKDFDALSFVTNLKVRASYGLVGNDRVSPYQYSDDYYVSTTLSTPAYAVIGGNVTPYIYSGVYPNANITWEKAKITDIGLEGSLWNDKLGFEFDYFYKHTTDILRSRILSVPGTFGRTLPDENYAVVDNEGFELSVYHRNSVGDIRYTVRANANFAQNTAIILDEPENTAANLRLKGRPLDFRTGLISDGLFQSMEEIQNSPTQYNNTTLMPGDIKYLDINGDGNVDDYDKAVISYDNSVPKWTLGLYLNAAWKGLDVSALFQGAVRVNYLMAGTARNLFNNGGTSNSFKYLLDSWTPENTGADYPRAWVDANANNNYTSDFWLRKTPYVRLKSLELGYTVPKLKPLGIDKLRIYFSAYNLFTWSKFKLFDPEVSSDNGSYYPQQKNYNVGVSLTF